MKGKKETADWYVAITHWLTSGLAIPFLISLIVTVPISKLIGKENQILYIISASIISIFGIWLGVIYSAHYLDKKYIIKNAQKITILSTIFLSVVNGVYFIFTLLQNSFTTFIIKVLFFVLEIFVFYFVSKRYIHNTTIIDSSAQNNTVSQNNSATPPIIPEQNNTLVFPRVYKVLNQVYIWSVISVTVAILIKILLSLKKGGIETSAGGVVKELDF